MNVNELSSLKFSLTSFGARGGSLEPLEAQLRADYKKGILKPVATLAAEQKVKTRTFEALVLPTPNTIPPLVTSTAEMKRVLFADRPSGEGTANRWVFSSEKFSKLLDIKENLKQGLSSEKIAQHIDTLVGLLNETTPDNTVITSQIDKYSTQKIHELIFSHVLGGEWLALLRKKSQKRLSRGINLESLVTINAEITLEGSSGKGIQIRDLIIAVFRQWINAVLDERDASVAPTEELPSLQSLAEKGIIPLSAENQ